YDSVHPSFPILSLHDALPIFPPAISLVLAIALSKDPGGIRVTGLRSRIPFATLEHRRVSPAGCVSRAASKARFSRFDAAALISRSEEHTSELQSQSNLVCRLL